MHRWFAAMAMTAMLLTACSSGVSQADLDAAAARVVDLEAELAAERAAAQDGESVVDEMAERIATLETTNSELEARVSAASAYLDLLAGFMEVGLAAEGSDALDSNQAIELLATLGELDDPELEALIAESFTDASRSVEELGVALLVRLVEGAREQLQP